MDAIRDFSVAVVDKIETYVLAEEKEMQDNWYIGELIEDARGKFSRPELKIEDYLDDISDYHEKAVDQHNTGTAQFETILKNVKKVDDNYFNRFSSYESLLQDYKQSILYAVNLLNPVSLSSDPANYSAMLKMLETTYFDRFKAHLERIDDLDIEFEFGEVYGWNQGSFESGLLSGGYSLMPGVTSDNSGDLIAGKNSKAFVGIKEFLTALKGNAWLEYGVEDICSIYIDGTGNAANYYGTLGVSGDISNGNLYAGAGVAGEIVSGNANFGIQLFGNVIQVGVIGAVGAGFNIEAGIKDGAFKLSVEGVPLVGGGFTFKIGKR